LDDKQAHASFDVLVKFCPEQQRAFDTIRLAKSHVLVLGAGGSGKSFLIHALQDLMPNTRVCAFTGMAAANIGGQTIDSLLAGESSCLTSLKALIVDEISLCSAQKIAHLLSRGVKQLLMFGDFAQLPPVVRKEDVLPPPGTPGYTAKYQDALVEFSGHDPETGALFAFEHELFQSPAVRVIVLKTQYRQKASEKRLLHVLDCVRRGRRYDPELLHFFVERAEAYNRLTEPERCQMVHLFHANTQVREHNHLMFQRLKGAKQCTYSVTHKWSVQLDRYGHHSNRCPDPLIEAAFTDLQTEIRTFLDRVPGYGHILLNEQIGNARVVMTEHPRVTFSSEAREFVVGLVRKYSREVQTLSSMASQALNSGFPLMYTDAPPDLLDAFSSLVLAKRPKAFASTVVLRVGQRVMCTQNNRMAGIYNGLMGVVELLGPTTISIRTDDDRLVSVPMMYKYSTVVLQSKGAAGSKSPMVSTEYHLPVIGANAMTIHKAQGQTLQRAVLFLGSCNIHQPGLAYVALSRCSSECGLYLGETPHPRTASIHEANEKLHKQVQSFLTGTEPSMHCLVHRRCRICQGFYVPMWKGAQCRKC
jgi:hypothetical protein